MRGKKAKAIRHKVYGDLSLRGRKYTAVGTTVIADKKRQEYQQEKKLSK